MPQECLHCGDEQGLVMSLGRATFAFRVNRNMDVNVRSRDQKENGTSRIFEELS